MKKERKKRKKDLLKLYPHTYLHKYIRKYKHTYIHTYIHTTVFKKYSDAAAAECDPTERQGSSKWEVACQTSVTVCDKFQLVWCSQSVVRCG